MPSAPQAATAEAAAPSIGARFWRSAMVWIAAGAVVVVAGTGAWFAWRVLSRPPAPVGEPALANGAPTAAPVTAAPATETKATTSDPGSREALGEKPQAAPAPAGTGGAAAAQRETSTAAEKQELAAARVKFAAKQFGQASADLTAFLAKHPGSALAAEASLLQAQAIAAQPGRELDAITLYGDVASRYPNSSCAPEALYYKASLQDRLRLRETDRALAATVPASLATYRAMADRFPRAVLSQHALFRMAGMYEDLERYDLAAQAFEKLGASFPDSSHDGWFRAGELYERRLKDKEKARAAYLKVPPTSARYREAQKRAGK
jgi:TolA-binding protein